MKRVPMRQRQHLDTALRTLVAALALAGGAALPAGAQTAACDRSAWSIVLDPGHTPQNPGAISARGQPELLFNQALAEVVQRRLQQAGFTRVMRTTDADAAPTLAGRAAVANQVQADVFIALHHDSVQPQYLADWQVDGRPQRYSDRFRGHSIFVSDQNGDPAGSLRLARLLGHELRTRCLVPTLHHAEPIAGEGRLLLDTWRGIYRFDDLVVLKSTQMPAVLLEAGVIVHRAEELLLRSPARQQQMADALTAAVLAFCAGAAAPEPPPPVACPVAASPRSDWPADDKPLVDQARP
jgi:N-acetylmuramoyl-L-alanine amidase